MNVLFRGKMFFLNPAWNTFSFTNDNIRKHIEFGTFRDVLAYQEARKLPFIIHYADKAKPWDAPETDYAHEFWEVARHSPYYEYFLTRLMKNHLTQEVYHVTQEVYRERPLPWFPRKVRGFFRCLKKKGPIYTFKLFVKKCLGKIMR